MTLRSIRTAGRLLPAALLVLAGCAHHQQTRAKSDDEADVRARDSKEPPVKTIGDVTSFANADPLPVSGVGLVVGLEGTGGNPPPGGFLTLLEKQLSQEQIPHAREILASPNTSLVLVSGVIPAGAHKDDPIDVEISLPDGSRTTSLRGGYLKRCALYNYDTKKNLNPRYTGADGALMGHVVGWAEGPVLISSGEGNETERAKRGRIWEGGHATIARDFILVLDDAHKRGAVAMRVADRINETFHGAYRGPATDTAVAKTGEVVYLRVPAQYRLNLPRYLRVIRLIPMQDGPAERGPYRHRLDAQLLDPATAVTAALRLEALGHDSIPALKCGLDSKHALVRFSSAEALAYLGDASCGEELARLTEQQPALRAYCLTALASLDEAICHVKLRDLLASPSAETRYGAFRGLRTLDEREPAVAGEFLADSFWLHRAAPSSPGLVHVSTLRRPEIVLFGDDSRLVPPFSFLAGEFTVTAAADDPRCTVSHFAARHAASRRQCGLRVEDVIRTMGQMGCEFGDVVELLRRADSCQCLSCPLAVDALPQAVAVEELAKGKEDQLLDKGAEIIQARADMGATPTLYDKDASRRSPAAGPDQDDSPAPPEPAPAPKKRSTWYRARP